MSHRIIQISKRNIKYQREIQYHKKNNKEKNHKRNQIYPLRNNDSLRCELWGRQLFFPLNCVIDWFIFFPKAMTNIYKYFRKWPKHKTRTSLRSVLLVLKNFPVMMNPHQRSWCWVLKELFILKYLTINTVWPKYDNTSTERNSYELMWIFYLRCHHILVKLYHKTKIKPIKGQQRQFKPFIVEKKTRVADKKIQTDAWLTVVRHQDCQCQLIGQPLGKESIQSQYKSNERQ